MQTNLLSKNLPTKALFLLLFICAILVNAQGTLTITRGNFPSGALAYGTTDNWSAATSGSNTITGKADIFSDTSQTTLQMRNSSTPHLYNEVAMPGAITKITITKASGTDRAITPRMSATAVQTTATTAAGTNLTSQNAGTVSWTVDPASNYRYFYLTLGGGAFFASSIVIEYQTVSHTVTFNGNGNTSGTMSSQSSSGSASLTTNAFTKTNPTYSFAGWATSVANATSGSVAYDDQDSYPFSSDATLYAIWGFNVTYNNNGGNGSIGTQAGYYNSTAGTGTVMLSNGSGLTRTGHTFAGWKTTSGDGGSATYTGGASYSHSGASATLPLFAHWTINNYTVTYNGNAATGGSVPTPQNGNYNTSVGLSSNTGGLVKDGHTFTGWNTNAAGTGTHYDENANFTIPAGNTTLYAEWKLIASYSGVSAGAGAEPATMSSLINSQTDSVINFDFTVTDDNNIVDGNDSLPTLINQIVIPQSTGNDVANWTQAIEGAELSDGTNTVAGTVNATNITFSGIPAAVNTLGYIADGGNKTYSLKIWLRSSLGGTLPTTIDGANLVFKVDRTNFTTASSTTSTQFETGTGTVVESGANNNAVQVVATQLNFVQQPTNITVNANMSPAVTLSANDANGNRDRDYTTSVAITSTGTLTGTPVSSNAVSGLATFSTLRHTAAGSNLKLTANSSSFTGVESSLFNVTLVTTNTDYFKSKEVTGSWATAGNWLSSPDNVTWINSTLVPANTASGITISDNSTITVSAAATGRNITVENGGVLTVNNTFTISGTNVINGTWNQTVTTAISNSGTLAFGANSIYNHNANGGTIPTATWDDTSNCNVIGFTGSSNIGGLSGIGQNFGNLTFNNTKTGFINLFAATGTMTVRGVLTVGPLTSNLVSFGNDNFSVTANINKINVTGGSLNGVGSGTTLTLKVATDLVVENSGVFKMSTGTGNALVTIGNDVLLKDNGSLEVVAGTSTSVTSQILNVTRDFIINGTFATLNLRSNTSTNANVGSGIVNVGRNFSSNNTDTDAVDVDFGTTGTVTNNAVNITGNLTHTGNGVYQTAASGQARGFVFKGTASAPSGISYSGVNSDYTSYEVDTNAYVKLNTNLTLGSSTLTPISYFTVKGNLDFGDRSIMGNNVARFITASGAVLNTSNPNGIGGNTSTGSLISFSSTNASAGNGVAQLIAGANYTFNANTVAPFPTGTIGNPAIVNVNASVVNNKGATTVTNALNVNDGGKFVLNGHLTLASASLNIAEGGTFDNGGEYFITYSGTPSININGTFITRDAQGFTGTNTSIPGITPVLGDNSVIEYGLNGNQTVTGFAYKNLTINGSGIKTSGANNNIGSVTINDGATLTSGISGFGGSNTNLKMSGISKYVTGGAGTKPDIGTYDLAAGSTIEFSGGSATNIRIQSNVNGTSIPVQYANVIVSGTNVGLSGSSTVLQNLNRFEVANGGVFNVTNTNGFSGASNTAIGNANSPEVVLGTNSTINYSGASQNITNNIAYQNLNVSTAGIKTAATGTITVNGLTTVSAGTLKISETADPASSNVLYAHRGISNTGGTVTFGSNAQLMQDSDAANFGSMISARKSKLPKMGYTYWSSPVAAQNLYAFSNGGQTGGTPKNRFWLYDEATNLFKNTGAFLLNDTSTFIAGMGYAIRGMDDFGATTPVLPHEFTFIGTPNNGDISLPSLKWTNDAKGYNLVGNPYPSNIDFEELYNANATKIHPLAYFWTNNDLSIAQQQPDYGGNNYAIYNQMGGSPATYVSGDPNEPASASMTPTNVIKVGQGFIIKTQNGMNNQSLNFTNAIRLTDNGVFFNNKVKAQKDRFWLKMMSPANITNTILVGYAPGATNGYELAYDTELFVIGSDSFYSLLDSKKLAIQGRASFTKEDKVTLGNVYVQNGSYKIASVNKEGVFANGQSIYLKDKLLNKVVDISTTDYTFQAVKGTDHTRFEIIYKPEDVLNVDSNTKSDLIIYKDQNMQVVRSAKKLGKIEVYDVSGKLMRVLDVSGTEARIDTSTFSNGVYILKVENSGDVKTKKFIK